MAAPGGARARAIMTGRSQATGRDFNLAVAFEDRGAPQGVPLSQGRLHAGVLTCGAHEWQYHAATGHCLNPWGVVLRTFPVEVRDGEIWVELADR